jgi:hypothetical protein
MKRLSLLLTGVAGMILLAAATPTFAADADTKKAEEGKETTITGEAKCAKCALKEADKCQTVVEVERRNGRKVKYYLADNDVAKKFHEEVCKESKKVTVTGTDKVDETTRKHEFTAKKIEPAKKEKEKEG